MTKTELDSWRRNTSKEVRDWFNAQPCAPKYEQKTFVTTNNPYTSDDWDRLKKQFADYMGRNDDMNNGLTMEKVVNDLNEALSAFGRVINFEMQASANMVAHTEVTFEFFTSRIASRNDDAIIVRNIVLGLDYIRQCDITMNYINNTITLYLVFGNGRRTDMPVKHNSTVIKKVMFNGPATIVYWSDGTKTIVKCMEDEEFDPEKGLAMAICKRLYGGDFHRVFNDSLKNADMKCGDEAKMARENRVLKAKKKEIIKMKARDKQKNLSYTDIFD